MLDVGCRGLRVQSEPRDTAGMHSPGARAATDFRVHLVKQNNAGRLPRPESGFAAGHGSEHGTYATGRSARGIVVHAGQLLRSRQLTGAAFAYYPVAIQS